MIHNSELETATRLNFLIIDFDVSCHTMLTMASTDPDKIRTLPELTLSSNRRENYFSALMSFGKSRMKLSPNQL